MKQPSALQSRTWLEVTLTDRGRCNWLICAAAEMTCSPCRKLWACCSKQASNKLCASAEDSSSTCVTKKSNVKGSWFDLLADTKVSEAEREPDRKRFGGSRCRPAERVIAADVCRHVESISAWHWAATEPEATRKEFGRNYLNRPGDRCRPPWWTTSFASTADRGRLKARPARLCSPVASTIHTELVEVEGQSSMAGGGRRYVRNLRQTPSEE